MSVRLKNAPVEIFDGNDEFDRAMRRHFRERERATWQRRMAIAVVIIVALAVGNGVQAVFHNQSLKICGGRK